jgi:hypothetical protein
MRVFFFTISCFLSSCSGADCNRLTPFFNSYSEAKGQILNSHFTYKDKIYTSKSSWIKGAKYFSCNKQTGFFFLETDEKDYIHQNLPIGVWIGFKNATSFGQYYNEKIRHNYQLQLTPNKR